jgi:predicted CXXCH cytochrome family protein
VTSFRILAPTNEAIIKRVPVPFIGTVPDDLVSEVTLYINNYPVRLPVKNRSFSTMLTLQEGINNLRVEAKRARTLSMTLLYNPNLSEDMTYRLWYSHGILKKTDCRLCHTAEPVMTIAGPDQALCANCHEAKNRKKHLHGPVAAGGCTVCHDPHGATNPHFLVAPPDRLCFNCHTEKEVLLHFIDKSTGGMELLRSKGCSFCHDPHESDKKYLLKKS